MSSILLISLVRLGTICGMVVVSQSRGTFIGISQVQRAHSFRKKIQVTIRKTKTTDIIILSQILNPIIRGWMD